MTTALLTAAMFALNASFWWFDTVPVYRGVDPSVVLASLYGIAHIEALMIRATWYLHKAAADIWSGRTVVTIHTAQ